MTNALWVSGSGDPVKLYAARINYHQAALTQGGESSSENYIVECLTSIQYEALAKCFLDLGTAFLRNMNYPEALQANQRALDITKRFLGEEHESTADSYRQLGITQNDLHDYKSAFQSFKCALTIRVKLFEDHESTADSYRQLGVAQYNLDDYRSALQSQQRALAIHIKRFGDHKVTAESYRELGITQYSLCDYKSALQSQQCALAICIKLFGEDHKSTADSYSELSKTQYRLGGYKAALQSQQRALAIRIKLFGKHF